MEYILSKLTHLLIKHSLVDFLLINLRRIFLEFGKKLLKVTDGGKANKYFANDSDLQYF